MSISSGKTRLLWLFVFVAFFTIGCEPDEETNPKSEDLTLSDTFVYLQDNPYKEILKGCAVVTYESRNDTCSLSRLPLLMQEEETPTKEKIMQRVLVSDKWMGDRFSEMLDVLEDDIKKLLGAVTVIIIDNDIRPSFYWSVNGAMYIDPRYLWLTPAEAQTITVKDDYRKDYGSKLKFIDAWRYVKNGKYAYEYFPLDGDVTRTVSDLKYKLARLLYHELSHANDSATRDIVSKADKSKSIYYTLHNTKKERVSSKLYKDSPLHSAELMRLGKVLYQGRAATDEDNGIEADEVGALFDADSASDMYGYSSQYEDLAMMFEETMMKYHYDIDKDLAFIPKPKSDTNLTYRDYVVSWGKRNRIADPQVSARALYVVKSILPDETDWDDFFARELGQSIELKNGVSWWDNLNPDKSLPKLTKTKFNSSAKVNPTDFEIPDL